MEMEIMQECLTSLVLLGVAVLCAILAQMGRRGIRFIRDKAEGIENEEQRELVLDALDDLERLTYVTVSSLEQTTAKTLREAVKAGTAERTQLESLALVAAQEIKDQLQPQYKQAIDENFGSLDKYLKNQIETTLLQIKGGV